MSIENECMVVNLRISVWAGHRFDKEWSQDVTRDALVTVLVRGPLADVEAAVAAGGDAAGRVGEVVRAHVIPAPDPSIEFILGPSRPR